MSLLISFLGPLQNRTSKIPASLVWFFLHSTSRWTENFEPDNPPKDKKILGRRKALETKGQNWAVGETKQRGGKCGWHINLSHCFSAVGNLVLNLTPLGFLGGWCTGGAELSVSRADPGLPASGSRGPDTLELWLQPMHQGALVLSGGLPPPHIPPPPCRLVCLGRLRPQVPTRRPQPEQCCSHPRSKSRDSGNSSSFYQLCITISTVDLVAHNHELICDTNYLLWSIICTLKH